MATKVISFKSGEDLRWDFENSQCTYRVPDGEYTRHVIVDPFPAYAHDLAMVEVELTRTANAFPMPEEVTVCVLDREFAGRTNGWCSIGHFYGDKDERAKWSATIVLSGKRIPPHPATTRYLVAHEYGHAVRRFISGKRGEDDNKLYAPESLYGEYQRLRCFQTARHYGGGTWHACVEELFANDFRILVVGAEVEFWPHPGFARPEGVPAIVEFWKKWKDEVKPQ
jgi:hypothetical protein